MKEIPHLPSQYFCSPVGLVPKKTDGIQTGWRMIFDLSSPEGSSVNDGIPKHYGTISYETLADAMHLVAKAGKGAIMMKRDLKSAFRHIPINPHDYWLRYLNGMGSTTLICFSRLVYVLHHEYSIISLRRCTGYWKLKTVGTSLITLTTFSLSSHRIAISHCLHHN